MAVRVHSSDFVSSMHSSLPQQPPTSRAPLPRRCRVYQRATVDLVGRATLSWQAISGLTPAEPLGFSGGSCTDLARLVKAYLSQEVSDDQRWQMGFQSIKKLLPDSCRCMESGLLDKLVSTLGRPPRVLPPGYLSFVKKEVRRLFPKGWDASYERHCLSIAPPLTSTCELGRSDGGCLGALGGWSQSDFLDRVLHGRGTVCPSYRGQLLVVQSAGKPRPLSKFPAESLALKPLHKAIYGRLSKYPWLLRGSPDRAALLKAGFAPELGVLVSGDYSSATDNLPIEVMEVALAEMLSTSVFVPENVRDLARRACRPRLFSDSSSFEVRTGQMMGSLLSFPFLCLQNYLAFRWSCSTAGVRGHVPVLINGDDILFQKSDHFDWWKSVVGAVGLDVEPTKTSVSTSFGTINSTLLEWEDGALQPVWIPRFGMLRPVEHPSSLGRSFASFLRDCPSSCRFTAGRAFFDWHVGALRSAGVSLDLLGFRGLLSYRLARLYGLDQFRGSELPDAYIRHHVSFSPDFVSKLRPWECDQELAYASAIEICAAKWTCGWVPADAEREAILYCLRRTASKGRESSDALSMPGLFGTDAEFRFGLRNIRDDPGVSRRLRTKPFLVPLWKEDFVLVARSVVDSSFFEHEWLPPYEAVGIEAAVDNDNHAG